MLEYCGLGSVRDLIEVCDTTLSEAQIKRLTLNSLKGLVYLHLSGIVHRDLKVRVTAADAGSLSLAHTCATSPIPIGPRNRRRRGRCCVQAANILLTDECQVKIGDFGISERLSTKTNGVSLVKLDECVGVRARARSVGRSVGLSRCCSIIHYADAVFSHSRSSHRIGWHPRSLTKAPTTPRYCGAASISRSVTRRAASHVPLI